MTIDDADFLNLFEDIGEVIETVLTIETFIATIDDGYTELETSYITSNKEDLFNGLKETFDTAKDNVLSHTTSIAQICTKRLQHAETVVDHFPQLAGSTSIYSILFEIIKEMKSRSKSVGQSVLTLPSLPVDGTTYNDDADITEDAGYLIMDKELDGVNVPCAGGIAHIDYNGVNSQLAYPETLTIKCVSDNETNAVIEGFEIFSVHGQRGYGGSPWGWRTKGSGTGPSISPIQGSLLLINNDFEIAVDDVPTGWTIDDGTAATHIFVVSQIADVLHGTYSLRFTGNASESDIQISQDLVSTFVPHQRYVVAAYVKGESGISSGTLTIQIEDGEGSQIGSSDERINLHSVALDAQTTFELEYFYLTMPAEIPDGLEMVIKWTGTPSAHSVHIDWMGIAPVTYHGGINLNVVAGAKKFHLNDVFQPTLSYASTGKIQEFFRKYYKVQLPSSGSGTFNDLLAGD